MAVNRPSSRERFVAAAIAFSISGSRPSAAISTPSAAAVVPPGEVTFWRKVAASSGDRCSNSPEPDTVARASRAARSARQAGGGAGAREAFGEQEHIGRAGARNGGDRVEQQFIRDPFDRADRAEQPVGERALMLRDLCVRHRDRDAASDRSRRVRHRAHDCGVDRQRILQKAERLAGHDRDDERVRAGERLERRHHGCGVLRLDRDDDHARVADRTRIDAHAAPLPAR